MIEKRMPVLKRKQRLGELLVENGLINTTQLKDALKRQARIGGQLGSILVEMGHITTADLLNFLSCQLGIPSANLFELDISTDILKLMPLEKIKALKVVPINIVDNAVTLAMVNPLDMISIRDIEFSLGKKVNPIVVPSAQMDAFIRSMTPSSESLPPGTGFEIEMHRSEPPKAPDLISLLRYLADSSAKDMLLTSGVAPSIKLSNSIKRLPMAQLTPVDCDRYAKDLMSDKDWDKFVRNFEYSFTAAYPEIGRFRVNLYKQRDTVSISLRHIADVLPPLEELNLPSWVKEYALMLQGLIIVVGPAGHGKSTTVAALVDIINSNRKCNIVTLEEPIEYLHRHKKSNINQREIGVDAQSLSEGLKHILRHDPDVIVISETRDAESFAAALQAAESGHLVITTVLASSAASAIESIINMFPPHQQNFFRNGIAENLVFILSQRLVPMKKGEERILAHEKLVNSFGIKNLIIEGKTRQIKTRMLTGADEYSSLESSLAKLYLSGLIKSEDGLRYSENRQFYKDLTKIA